MIGNVGEEKEDIKVSLKVGAWVAGTVRVPLEREEAKCKSKVLYRCHFT